MPSIFAQDFPMEMVRPSPWRSSIGAFVYHGGFGMHATDGSGGNGRNAKFRVIV
jgi:hypothetical protein